LNASSEVGFQDLLHDPTRRTALTNSLTRHARDRRRNPAPSESDERLRQGQVDHHVMSAMVNFLCTKAATVIAPVHVQSALTNKRRHSRTARTGRICSI
jgi:hypothetical protein